MLLPESCPKFSHKNENITPGAGGGGGARGVLPSKRLCRWMGSHFHNWIDYNGGSKFFTPAGFSPEEA